MAKVYYVIQFNANPSGLTYLGQKDVFPLEDCMMGYGHAASHGVGDTVGHIELETSYFSPYSSTDTYPGIDQTALISLNAYLLELTTKKMTPDTITLMEITTTDDPANFSILKKIEHPNALVRVSGSSYVINSDTATLSTIPSGGTDANFVTSLDYKNKQVNGQ